MATEQTEYPLAARIRRLLEQMGERLYGKEHVVALSLLSAVAGESIFLLGPPGVAKSMVARRLKLAFREGSAFEYLMSRFSTPDEIFGPVSITKLKEEDRYERCTEGYLPTATVVFLDEIWKAGPAIQNALLTVLNEKVFRNGQTTVRVPLKGLVAASNELPAQGQGLDALWDRFLVRLLVTGIEDLSDFDRMIASADEREPEVDEELAISEAEYVEWQQGIAAVKIHYSVFEVIHAIKERIADYNLRLQNDAQTEAPFYVSDRRWKKWVKLMRTSAFLNGSDTVRLSDCLLLSDGLWNETGQRPLVQEMVQEAIRQSAEDYLLGIKGLRRELDDLRSELASETAVHEKQDPGLELVDSYYYQVERVRMAGRLLLFASDYQQLDDTGKVFYLQKDKYKTDCFVLKKYTPALKNKVPPTKQYTLRRGSRSVFINDYEYPLRCVPGCLPLPPVEVNTHEDVRLRFRRVEELIDRVEAGCRTLLEEESAYCSRHLFVEEQQRSWMIRLLEDQQRTVTDGRNELEELKHAYRKENEEYPAQ